MRVRFLGSGDAFGSGGRLQTCIALESPDFRALLDCGTSSLIALKRARIDPNQISTILVTHLHGDHFGGIPFFVLDAQFSRRSAPLTIAWPPGIAARVREALEVFFPGSSRIEQRFPIHYAVLSALETSAFGPLRVTAYEVVHACGAPPYALRIELDGRTIAYSGDTEWTDALVAAARGADLFICEAYFYEKVVRFHLDYATLARNRERLDCKRLLLTHLGPDMLARLDDVDAETACDGLEITL